MVQLPGDALVSKALVSPFAAQVDFLPQACYLGLQDGC